MFKNKIILVTGGTGSFGSAMVKFLLKNNYSFKEIRILSRDEKKQDDLRKELNSNKVKFFLGDVKDRDSLNLPAKNVNYIFHAAAYKQVPSCEFYPMEAVKTNIIGTNNLIRVAEHNNIEKVICLSTDKAVYPINAMGISKSMMEKVVLSNAIMKNIKPTVCVTRYGNVIGSRGSVIPLFINQIVNNKPITITDPNMTRFIMSMSDALELVLYALKKGKNGQIFIKKANAAKIITIAESIKLMLDKPNHQVNIIGSRHGEKKHEYLLSDEENYISKETDNYFTIESDNRDLNYNLYYNKGNRNQKFKKSYSSENVKLLSTQELIKFLKPLNILNLKKQ